MFNCQPFFGAEFIIGIGLGFLRVQNFYTFICDRKVDHLDVILD